MNNYFNKLLDRNKVAKLTDHLTAVRPIICIQGLGFVGAAMATAVANARNEDDSLAFNVIGVDLPTVDGLERITSINSGIFPFPTTDEKLIDALQRAIQQNNLIATSHSDAYSMADVVIVDVHCDIIHDDGIPRVNFGPFVNAIRTVAEKIQPYKLIIVETTVPPGTCEKIVLPELQSIFRKRGLPVDSILLAHSYERVMPGREYYDSIVNFWRVYSGHNNAAAEACHNLLSKTINVKEFPLTRLASTTASETAKVLENSYRAVNIAFIDEWSRFAESAGVDLFEVIDAIRLRPTHSNMRQPGFGVGGYCLTKDPLFGLISARDVLDIPNVTFPLSTLGLTINQAMPVATLDRLQSLLPNKTKSARVLLMGVSYRSDVGDTRYSPSELFFKEAKSRGIEIIPHDPLVAFWQELAIEITQTLPDLLLIGGVDAVVFAVAHEDYKQIDFQKWLQGRTPLIIDANRVLTVKQVKSLEMLGCSFSRMGTGQ